MIFGFNTDVPAKEGIYHVQTEDRGAKNPVIESIIYIGGKIMSRRRTPYVVGEVSKEQIEDMVRRQHKDLLEAIRSGTWVPSGDGHPAPVSDPKGYFIALVNPDHVRHGEYLRFQLLVRDKGQDAPAANVSLDVRWVLGETVVEQQSLVSQADGSAELWLPRPSEYMSGTLLIRAQGTEGKELAKFLVRGSAAD